MTKLKYANADAKTISEILNEDLILEDVIDQKFISELRSETDPFIENGQ